MLFYKQQEFVENLRNYLACFCAESSLILPLQKGFDEIAFWGARYFLQLLQANHIFTAIENYQISDIKERLMILPYYDQQLYSLLDILIRHQLISSPQIDAYTLKSQEMINLQRLLLDKQSLLERYPQLATNINFLHALLDRYTLVLSGKESFLNVLFANSSFDTVIQLYKNEPILNYYNRLTVTTIIWYVNCLLFRGKRSINVLEIGAGIGSVTEQVLPLLHDLPIAKTYHYTDISQAFLAYGRNQFQQSFGFLKFSKLNINQSPIEQGFEPHNYDIILAANVIHNACDIVKTLGYISSLLQSDGIVILSECTMLNDYSTLIYGLSQAGGFLQIKNIGCQEALLLVF